MEVAIVEAVEIFGPRDLTVLDAPPGSWAAGGFSDSGISGFYLCCQGWLVITIVDFVGASVTKC